MKRLRTALPILAAGLLVATVPASAQDTIVPKESLNGQASISLLSTTTVDSAKFQEYRDLSNGIFGPQFSVSGTKSAIDFNFAGQNLQQKDQRYFGAAGFSWGSLAFNYNQTPHNMGNNGLTVLTQTAPGVWTMNSMLREEIATTAADASSRNYPFYQSLLAPTFAAGNRVDLTGLRKRGDVEFTLGQKLPFDLAFTYEREVKTGVRGANAGDIVGLVSSSVDVPQPMNEVVQDFGIRWAYNLPKANLHASFNRNVYNDRIDALILANPFQAIDSATDGGARTRFSTAPDNQAMRGAFGVQLKFARQTRVTADAAFGTMTQNAAFLPMAINSAILTPSLEPATSLSVLPQASLNGKINTTMVNFSVASRPVRNLGIRLRYRSYDMANKTPGINWTGSTAGSPDRTWSVVTPTADAPYGGFVTANPYSSKTARFDAQVSYDISDVTLEAVLQHSALDRTYREATSGADNVYGFAAVFHAKDWLGFRGSVNQLHRTAKGNIDPADTTFLGFQADEAERKTNRATVDIELTPSSVFGFTFAYSRRHDDYPNRPQRSVSVPSYIGNADLAAGLLNAGYDEYTAEFDVTPGARAELSAYYTYEKNTTTTQRIAGSRFDSAVTDLYRWNGLDKGNTFGLNAVIHVVPEEWTFTANAQRQKVDGLLGVDFRLNPTGSYTTGRAALGGPQPITQYDDTTWTTLLAQIDRSIGRMTLSVGYAYERYQFANAFQVSTFPANISGSTAFLFMNADDGNYKANLGFATLSFKF